MLLGTPSSPSPAQVRHDTLDLRVPVWVREIGFVPGSGSQPTIAVGTGHHQVRVQGPTSVGVFKNVTLLPIVGETVRHSCSEEASV